jgi:hypothetical protein
MRTLIAAVIASVVFVPGVARTDGLYVHVRSIYADEDSTPLNAPEGVVCSDDRLIVADSGNRRLVSYLHERGAVSGGKSLHMKQIAYPVRAQLDSKGNLLVLDRKKRMLARVGAGGEFLDEVEFVGAGRVVPVSFALDKKDNIHVLDVSAARVVVVESNGALQRNIRLPGGVFVQIAVGPTGMLYAVEGPTATIWAAAPGATAFTALTKDLKHYMNYAGYLAVTDDGLLYLVDQNGSGIVLLNADGTYRGRQLALGWGEGQLYYPGQICISRRGELFVADRGNNRVQVFTRRTRTGRD